MKKLTGLSIITIENKKRIVYTYNEIDDRGELISTGNKGNFVASGNDILSAIGVLEKQTEKYL